MSDFVIVIIVLLAVLSIVLISSIRMVPAGRVIIIQRLGKYQRTAATGVTILMPFLDRVAANLSVTEQSTELRPSEVFTKDSATVVIDAIVSWQLTDAKLFHYGAIRPEYELEKLIDTEIRNLTATMNVDDVLSSRGELGQRTRNEASRASAAWGITIHAIEIRNLTRR